MKTGYYQTPAGTRIVATVDRVYVTAGIGAVTQLENGKFEVDYEGGSKVHWDTQEQQHDDMHNALFMDDDNQEWPENELIFVEEE